jgi:hypothetical protein
MYMVQEYLQISVAEENAVTCPVAHLRTEAQPASEKLNFNSMIDTEKKKGERFGI